MTLFGASAVRSYKRITLVIELEIWDAEKTYDRLGLEEEKLEIINTPYNKTNGPGAARTKFSSNY